MKATFPIKTIFVLLLTLSLFNCSKEEVIPGDIEINNFVWSGMNAYYKWQGNVDDLADAKFSTRDQLNEYLEDFESPDLLFEDLKLTTDSFSYITNDYTIIEDAFDGIKLTTGMKANFMSYEDGTAFYIYVYDVIEGSNAQAQGVTRGMIITAVNGTLLRSTNINALFRNDAFTITLADYNNGNPVNNGIVLNLTKTQVQEDPIKIAKIFNVGSEKIGYLLYNSFSSAYDGELNSVFGSFKSEVLNDLIIDLRYNGDGAVETASYLGSMITGQYKNEVFAKQIWNDKVMTNVSNQNVSNFFTDEIDNGEINQEINSLGLSTVYIIVSDATATAAEVLINGLKEYIDVKLIGIQTAGLAEASMTIYDSDDYTKTGENFNTSHTWAFQPIVLEVQNANNTNQLNGHVVDVELQEDAGNLGVLGEASDPLLSSTIEYITTGAVTPYTITTPVNTYNFWNSTMDDLSYNSMYVTLRD